jgi:hypothetical protein
VPPYHEPLCEEREERCDKRLCIFDDEPLFCVLRNVLDDGSFDVDKHAVLLRYFPACNRRPLFRGFLCAAAERRKRHLLLSLFHRMPKERGHFCLLLLLQLCALCRAKNEPHGGDHIFVRVQEHGRVLYAFLPFNVLGRPMDGLPFSRKRRL